MVDCPHEGCTNSFYSEKNLQTHLKSVHGIEGIASLPSGADLRLAIESGVVGNPGSELTLPDDVETRLCPFCGISLPTSLYCAHLSMKHDIRSEGLSTVTGKPHKKR